MTYKVITKFIRRDKTLKEVQRALIRYGCRGMLVQTDEGGRRSVIGWLDGSAADAEEFRKQMMEEFDVQVV